MSACMCAGESPCGPDTPGEMGPGLTYPCPGPVASCGHKVPALWLGFSRDPPEHSACQHGPLGPKEGNDRKG